MQQGCPQPHEEVPSALEILLLESASYIVTRMSDYLRGFRLEIGFIDHFKA
jgi:hypothetical protein